MSIIAKGKIIKNKKCSHLVVLYKFDLLFNIVSKFYDFENHYTNSSL
jgi:hypothetical protein